MTAANGTTEPQVSGRVSGRVALVTGASGGIGRATALALAEAGYAVWAGARRPEAVAADPALAAAVGGRVVRLDVTDGATMAAAVAAVEAADGGVDVLVNNAGYGLMGPLEELDMDEVRRQFETNVFGMLRMTQLVLPGMRRRGGGRVVNVGSVGGLFSAPGAGPYHMSKYAVEAFSDALRVEVRPFGVGVVLIEPTGVRTGFIGTQLATMPLAADDGGPYAAFKRNLAAGPRVRAKRLFEVPVPGLIVDPEDVARTIVGAVRAERPRARYKVGLSAHVLPAARRWLPDRAWDAAMARQFPA